MIICPLWRVLRLPRAEERLRQAGGKGQGFRVNNNENIREKVKPDSRTKEEKNLENGEKEVENEKREREETVKLSEQRQKRKKKQDRELRGKALK